MASTPIQLFRAGNKTSARFDYLRPGEVDIYANSGVDWVRGRTGGASTLAAPSALRGTWWRLPVGTTYNGAVLYLCNDYDDHWSWQPDSDMPLAVYVAALAAVNPKFITP